MNFLRPLAELLIVAVFIVAFYSLTNFFLANYLDWDLIASFSCGLAFSLIRFTDTLRAKISILLGALFFLLLMEIEQEQVLAYSLKLTHLALGLFSTRVFRRWPGRLASLMTIVLLNFWLLPYILVQIGCRPGHRLVSEHLSSAELLSRDSLPYHFIKGKVYLLNFSFVNCLPCRRKHASLDGIKQFFRGDKRVEVLLVHSDEKEGFTYFKRFSKDDFHEEGRLAHSFGVNSFPRDFIIDKRGYVRRIFGAFDPSQAYFYQKETIELLKKLANE